MSTVQSKQNPSRQRLKGWPAAAPQRPGDDLARAGWNLLREDLMLPAAVLSETAIAHNRAWMRRFTAACGVGLAPHGKTTMSPQLFAMQMEDGAWGLTAATAGHVRTYRDMGIGRIILANQLVGRQATAWICAELERDPDFDFYCIADSADSVSLLETAVAAAGLSRPLQILLELGFPGGRTGLRDNDAALALARRIAGSPHLSLRGIEAFEGIFQKSGDCAPVVSLLDRMNGLAAACRAERLFDGIPILSAGGSAFFDLVAWRLGNVADAPAEIILRSGCYLVHDSQFYNRLVETLIARSPEAAAIGGSLRPALEIWAYVHSRPEPGRIILGAGRRDMGDDSGAPVPLKWARPGAATGPEPLPGDHVVVRLDDQHAYLDAPAGSPLRTGDMVALGVSHPCTTFDKWKALYLVNDGYDVVGLVETCF